LRGSDMAFFVAIYATSTSSASVHSQSAGSSAPHPGHTPGQPHAGSCSGCSIMQSSTYATSALPAPAASGIGSILSTAAASQMQPLAQSHP